MDDWIKKKAAKALSDFMRPNSLTRKAIGALPIVSLAVEAVEEYKEKLETTLRNIGEGLKTAAIVDAKSNYERAEVLEAKSRQLNEFLLETTVTMGYNHSRVGTA